MKKQKLCEREITEVALIKMFKITVFIVKKHWAHTNNFDDTVRFIDKDLHEQILSEYLKLSVTPKYYLFIAKFSATFYYRNK